ncbi:MAG: hypothetical protein AYK19_21225 [Theionarchaea archaeon DG-70-1]|nr:MAG: hypothetical protein AYK19_21225 [Theionarchaea archaeon DG-70-1]
MTLELAKKDRRDSLEYRAKIWKTEKALLAKKVEREGSLKEVIEWNKMIQVTAQIKLYKKNCGIKKKPKDMLS